MNRRTFVTISASGAVLLAGGIPLSSLYASGRARAPMPRMPLHEFVRDPARLASFRRGVAVMKSRKPSDPRSWFFQAAIHGVPTAWIAAAAQSDPGVAKVDQLHYWNRCPHFPHVKSSGADFLIWHRAYLYYFERILRDAAGDEGLSLPYWDYSSEPASRLMPAAFADPEPDPVTGRPGNPLYHEHRSERFKREGLTAEAVSLHALNRPAFFGPNQLAGMYGTKAKGVLDTVPHGLVHSGIGQDMNQFNRAAFDPLFWVHHCNVDRLWAQWDTQAGKEWGQAPPPSWFEEKPWWFHDADGEPVSAPRVHFIQRHWLPVKYDFEMERGIALSQNLPGPDGVLDLGEVLAARDAQSIVGFTRVTEVASASGTLALNAQAPASALLEGTVQAESMVRQTVLKSMMQRRPSRTERFVFLELAGIPSDVPEGIGFDVHLNAAAGTVPERTSPSFVGTLGIFGGSGHGAHDGGFTELFDITDRVERGGLDNRTLVTLVPFALVGDGTQPLPRAAELPIEAVRIFVAAARRSEPPFDSPR